MHFGFFSLDLRISTIMLTGFLHNPTRYGDPCADCFDLHNVPLSTATGQFPRHRLHPSFKFVVKLTHKPHVIPCHLQIFHGY